MAICLEAPGKSGAFSRIATLLTTYAMARLTPGKSA